MKNSKKKKMKINNSNKGKIKEFQKIEEFFFSIKDLNRN